MWVKYNERARMIVDLCAGCYAALCQITVSVNFMEDAVNTKCNHFYLDDWGVKAESNETETAKQKEFHFALLFDLTKLHFDACILYTV